MGEKLSDMDTKHIHAASRLDTLETNYKALCDHYEATMKDVAEAIRKLNGQSQQGVTFGGQIVPTSNEVVVLQADHVRLQSEVNNLKAHVASSNVVTQGTTTGAWRTKLDNLKRKMTDLEGNSGQMFVHKRMIFRTKQDVKQWVVLMTVESAGMYWDLFSAMVCMKPKTQSGRERADESYLASRTKTTTLENDLLASMSHLRPALLFGKPNGTLAAMEEGFGACGSHTEWLGTGLDSYSTLMTNHLTEFIAGVNGTVDLSTTIGPEHDFSRELLDKVDKGWSALLRFTDRFYTKLTVVAKFSNKTAWQLVGRCWAAVFEEMRPFRACLKEVGDTKTAEGKASVIWGVLQQHRVMDEFMSLKFEAHPAIVRELSLFIITERVDPQAIIKQGERLTAEEVRVKSLEATVKDMGEKQATGKRNLDNLTNDFKQYKLQKK
jgi:hypothetical protein